MLFIAIASVGLVLAQADFDPARVHAAKAAYQNCLFAHAEQMDDGKSDIESVAKGVAQSCEGEFQEMLYAETPGADANTRAAAEANVRSLLGDVAVMAVQNARAERRGK